MKKSIILFLVSVVCTAPLFAQSSFGIKAGVVNSNWKGDALNTLGSVVEVTNGFISKKSKTGFTIGAYANIPVVEKFEIETAINYTKRGYALRGDLAVNALKFLGVNASAHINANYIDVPVLLKTNVTKRLQLYAGPQVSYLAQANFRVRAGVLGINVYNRTLDLTNNFNRLDVAITGGIGYKISKHLNLAAGYDYGLSRLDNNKNLNAYNRTAKLSASYSF
jgi:hypothetical protein